METPMRLLPALSLMILMAPADTTRAQTALADGPVMEIVTFRLVAGAEDAVFLHAAKGTADPLQLQPGFLGRSLTRAEDGTWTDHVLWDSMAAAKAGADAMMAEPAFGPFMALIDGPTVSMRHEPVLWRMD
jgi:heme-degrading monooxygenase HmoA